jgi:hypothetical protein
MSSITLVMKKIYIFPDDVPVSNELNAIAIFLNQAFISFGYHVITSQKYKNEIHASIEESDVIIPIINDEIAGSHFLYDSLLEIDQFSSKTRKLTLPVFCYPDIHENDIPKYLQSLKRFILKRYQYNNIVDPAGFENDVNELIQEMDREIKNPSN